MKVGVENILNSYNLEQVELRRKYQVVYSKLYIDPCK